MEPLSDTLWDVVICGTGLQQSLLALALSRSGKKILHIDPNEFYGGAEAALSLQEAEQWVGRISSGTGGGLFRAAAVSRSEDDTRLSPSRAYSLALAPTVIHARSALLSQLVSSRAYRQVEFLAVGAFYIFKPPQDPAQKPTLARIPSTREEVFSTTAVATKSKRLLMKFLKFVLDYEASPQRELWQPHADAPLTDLLRQEFKMDAELQTYILTLTLSLDDRISTRDGLAVIHRHLSSMGVYGPGFAALYPKWGGLSEIAQVSCRAGAVGGAVYMLATGIKETESTDDGVKLLLTSGDSVKARMLVRADDSPNHNQLSIRRLVAVVDSPLSSLFEAAVEGAPKPAVAVIAFPVGSVEEASGTESQRPIYLSAHSSDTGECPAGQTDALDLALQAFLRAVPEDRVPKVLFKLQYDQLDGGSESLGSHGPVFTFPTRSSPLSFDDSVLEPVREVWKKMMGDAAVEAEYMVFEDREGAVDDDDVY
ncbi:uncharacterized protein THITE_2086774 [Thermothielavioides terrestris NRRL 8126]|uniref:Rab proteins geranylgeranyltransferase n=1 Tax=Thermothielavioides terrestris (strain ATCC 38088 / NRRL 8126) TaxID=578455 RepID=G2R516_THETT|nr:uncharacterized protein THITE_2086774 [Thermothielavioides terrestris NRRL 8126]AEO65293.1 hypothetical protein THITE_2086774 [Thermothielavioides terrestris NRRL 8126]